MLDFQPIPPTSAEDPVTEEYQIVHALYRGFLDMKRSFLKKPSSETGLLLLGFSIVFIFLQIAYSFKGTSQRFYQRPKWREDAGPTLPMSRDHKRNRVFFSAIPKQATDGLGHRFSMINYELLLALHLDVGYVHRVGKYGSLSPRRDPLAIERTFGWDGWREIREDVMGKACKNVKYVQPDGCPGNSKDYPMCESLRTSGPFKHLILVPRKLVECYKISGRTEECRKALEKFAMENNEPDTVFQMEPWMCRPYYRSGNLTSTGKWFREHYWGSDFRSQGKRATVLQREGLNYEVNRIQVAVHIRRGDFLYYVNRTMVSDAAYADVIGQIKLAADEEFGIDVPMSVAIFSEGVPKGGLQRVRDNHNVGEMDPIYVTESGTLIKEPTKHWEKLIRKRVQQKDVHVTTYIATNTIQAIHAMIGADVFIGSRSGLSLQLVLTLARGLVVLPAKKGEEAKDKGFFQWFSHNQTYGKVVREGVRMGLERILEHESVKEWSTSSSIGKILPKSL